MEYLLWLWKKYSMNKVLKKKYYQNIFSIWNKYSKEQIYIDTLKLLCDYIDKLYELLKNLNSALDHDDVELRMFSESLPENS